jgi:hypothetical protein
MEDSARAAIAYIAGRLVTGRQTSHVYDYGRGSHASLGGSVTNDRVQVYDYDRSCHISGRPATLYDYGRSCHVQLKVAATGRFSGYDYGSSSHFNGRVSGRSISVYDYEMSSHFNYQL